MWNKWEHVYAQISGIQGQVPNREEQTITLRPYSRHIGLYSTKSPYEMKWYAIVKWHNEFGQFYLTTSDDNVFFGILTSLFKVIIPLTKSLVKLYRYTLLWIYSLRLVITRRSAKREIALVLPSYDLVVSISNQLLNLSFTE